MGLAKKEDYTKDNLVELYLFLEEELERTKIGANSSGFTKYSVVGSAVIKYRKELKYIRGQVANDLIEDFGFVHFNTDIQAWKDEKEKLKEHVITDPTIRNARDAQRILDERKINEAKGAHK